MGRERREFKRPGFKREYNRLFVIATEGQQTEIVYFGALNDDNYVDTKKIYIKTVPSVDGKSDPKSVINNLDKFKENYSLYDDDQLWMVIDFDRWGEKKLKQVARQCKQKGYRLAVSNPCFELWLLLHLEDVSELDDEAKEKLLENKKIGKGRNRTYIEGELIKLCAGYSKSKPDCSQFIPKVNYAISNAKKLHTEDSATQRWPEGLGTFVYKLVEELLKK